MKLTAQLGADRTKLLELQAASDRDRRRVEDRAVAVGTYVPTFLTIKARQITEWAAGQIQAREDLPVLLRRLIRDTGRELRAMDFPGYDNAQRHGWDGWVEAGGETPWVPEGHSGWEFGVGQDPKAKAERDYRARLNMLSDEERAETTFVFVTPRKWSGKVEWERKKKADGDWKAVKAFDASDLEQWIEETITPRIWLAGKLRIPTAGFQTADRFWDCWARASDPPLTAAIFTPSLDAHVQNFKKWLEKDPSDGPFTVAADSKEEAVAFIACLLRDDRLSPTARDQGVVFESAETLRTLAGSSSPFIPIVHDEETEREIAAVYRQRHCVVVRPRNSVDRKPDAAVEMLGHAAFEQALTDMGVKPERIDRLADESGRSPTVLRRRLLPDAIRTPPWAKDQRVAQRLMPMALVGTWHSGSSADCEILARLADRDYNTVEKDIADLLRVEDCPIWSGDQHHGVVSKIDALFAISSWITRKDLTDFVDCAKHVLSESDGAAELAEDLRQSAGLRFNRRKHSNALRTGIRETVVMLSVHGNARIGDRLGIDITALVADLVKGLLMPFTREKLRSHDRDLPDYAEAAPSEFLNLIEEGLDERQAPAPQELLKPANAGLFGEFDGIELLWALERLAWSPPNLARVVTILGKLSQTKIDDNWHNKAMDSLSAIFCSWLPQTAAPLKYRTKALEMVCRRFPDVGWQICLQQFEGGTRIGRFSERPRWRDDAAGAGRGVTDREPNEFARKALDLALAWRPHDSTTLGDLVDRLDNVPDEDKLSIWNLIDTWSQTETDNKARADLRERIRRTVLTRRGRLGGLKAETIDRARRAREKLAPRDPVSRHAWLFADAWVDVSAEEESDEHIDWEAQDMRIDELRKAKMAKIWSSSGPDGALALLADCDAWTVGRYAASCAIDQHAADVLRSCLATEIDPEGKVDNFMRGFLWFVDENIRSTLISTLAETSGIDQSVRLFGCAPFREQTWRLLDRHDSNICKQYWRTVVVPGARFTESETSELIDRLLEAERPWDGFFAVRFDWKKVETSRLRRLLKAIGNSNKETPSWFERQPEYLSKAMDSLDGRPGVTTSEMAKLEFTHIQALGTRGHGIANIEREFTESPSWFVDALCLCYPRNDGRQDPPQLRIDDPDRRRSLQTAADRLLHQTARIPGATEEGEVNMQALKKWVSEARRLCNEHGRTRIGDEHIGQLLSRAAFEENGIWPCQPICEVLQTIASEDIGRGFENGAYNARGVQWRNFKEGGEQERELSARYRAWAQRLAFDYPYVARILERITQGYDRNAKHWDTEARVMNRLER